MNINLINAMRSTSNTAVSSRKALKPKDSDFEKVLDKSIKSEEPELGIKKEKGSDIKIDKLKKKDTLKEKEATDSKDDKTEDSNTAENKKLERRLEEIIHLLLGMDNSIENNVNIEKLLSALSETEKNSFFAAVASVNNVKGSEKEIIDQLQAMFAEDDSNIFKDQLKAMLMALKNETVDSDKSKSSLFGEKQENFLADNEALNKPVVQNSGENSNGGDEKGSMNSSKEDKVLKSILGEKDDNSNKAVTMAAHLNRFRQDINVNSETTNIPVINKTTLNADIIKAVKYIEANSLRELTVNINPRELGQITIRITMEAGIMKANIAAANKETLELLNSNLVELRNSLNNSEVKVQEVSINIYNEDTTFFSGNFGDRSEGFNRNGQGFREERVINTEETKEIKTDQNSATRDNNLSILA
jgi:flagellar hook-length control protein FliK